jgi:hypothetical protein
VTHDGWCPRSCRRAGPLSCRPPPAARRHHGAGADPGASAVARGPHRARAGPPAAHGPTDRGRSRAGRARPRGGRPAALGAPRLRAPPGARAAPGRPATPQGPSRGRHRGQATGPPTVRRRRGGASGAVAVWARLTGDRPVPGHRPQLPRRGPAGAPEPGRTTRPRRRHERRRPRRLRGDPAGADRPAPGCHPGDPRPGGGPGVAPSGAHRRHRAGPGRPWGPRPERSPVVGCLVRSPPARTPAGAGHGQARLPVGRGGVGVSPAPRAEGPGGHGAGPHRPTPSDAPGTGGLP